MFTKSKILCGVTCAVMLACVAGTAAAQPADKRTFFTFSGPVALPGLTLPAGQYLFRLADPTTSRKVIQVLSADGRKPYALFFTMSAERFEPAPNPEVRFMETAAGMPAAIKTWWYPGERTGYEFVYPKDQARRLAQGASQPVLTTQAQTTTTEQTNTNELTRISSAGQESNVSADAAPTAATPTGTNQQGEIASSTIAITTPTIPAVADAGRNRSAANLVATNNAQARRTRTSLPKTAGNTTLVALIGTLALGAGVGLWVRRRGRAHA
jgi:LPXTG-motif cell wall-anchored protein